MLNRRSVSTGAHAIVHIGPMKSGSSALARYLTVAESRGELPANVIYPIGDLWFDRRENIVKQLGQLRSVDKLDRSTLDPSNFSAEVAAVDSALARVGAVLRERGNATAIFIVETAGRDTTPAALRSWFTPHFDTVTFVTMARRQDLSVPSMIAQRVKDFGFLQATLDPRDFVVAEYSFLATIDYALLRDEWSTPDSPLRVIPYLEGEQGSMAMISRFFRYFDLGEPATVRGIEGKRVHPTFSRTGLEALIAIKRSTRRFRWLPGMQARMRARFDTVWKVYYHAAATGGLEPSGRHFAAFSLSPEESSWVLDRFSESNARLSREIDRTGLEAEWEQWFSGIGMNNEK
jgi:hypothetical protein